MNGLIYTLISIILLACGQIDGTAIAPSTSPHKRIFITSTFYNGNFGGIDAGDQFCAFQADKAGLGGKWRAYLSTPSVDALDRIEDVGPWYRVDQVTLLFSDKDQFTSGPDNEINMNEFGDTVPTPSYAWTGTTTAGIYNNAEGGCLSWGTEDNSEDGALGSATVTTASWQRIGYAACNFEFRLYCIEQ